MRIIAGTAKGRVLRSLKGLALRPTADRVREAVFAMLVERVPGARFLDLFAGAGGVGLEALSRGAAQAVFVESHRPAARVIEENVARCGLADRARVLALPVARALAVLLREGARFDLIFLDPPYERGEVGAVMARLGQRAELLAPGGLVVCQRSRHEDPGETVGALGRMREARFGETRVDFYARRSEQPGGEPGQRAGRPGR